MTPCFFFFLCVNMDQFKGLPDAEVMQVYWAGEQVRWINTISNHLNSIKTEMEDEEEREFAYHIYILCSITEPFDANCVIDLESKNDDLEYSRFRIQVSMGFKRWMEFRWGATAFIQDVIRQVSLSSTRADDKVGGFKLTQFKDHISVQDGGGLLIKKKE